MITFSPKKSLTESEAIDRKNKHRKLTKQELAKEGIVLLSNTVVSHNEGYRILASCVDEERKIGNSKLKDFYVGITNDLVDRKYKHEHDDHGGKPIKAMYAVRCESCEVAKALEDVFGSIGLNNGNAPSGNGAADDTDFVYIYKIPK